MKKSIGFNTLKQLILEAHEIHSYPVSLNNFIEKLTNDHNEINVAFYNNDAKVFWYLNSKGYYHILKFKKMKSPHDTIDLYLIDMILKDNGAIEEVERYRFDNIDDMRNWLKVRHNWKSN